VPDALDQGWMEPKRPNPDELLAQVVADEKLSARGKLTIFFGAAPGVGKTYAMLEAARAAKAHERRDTLVGVVETHGRYETAALVQGLELLPRRQIDYRGVTLAEFDLDGALARKPELVLIDELAHTNAEGSRHPKRWQDVEELLDAGIDVFTTMNVQHVESLNDVIAKITGVVVRETVPDSMLEQAHEIKLVDLPPDALLERLREGKVYVSAQAQRAIENFFRKGNLIALRELALRHTAERVDAQMRAYRKAQGIEQTWAAADLLLVAVSPSPHSARLIRATRRMASSLHARWCAVYVETPRARQLPKPAQARLSQNLRLAQQLGAEVVTLSGDDASEEIVRFARERNITQIIVGKPGLFRRWNWNKLRPSLVDKLIRLSGDIDVYMTAGDTSPEARAPAPRARPRPHLPSQLWAVLLVACTSAAAWLLFGREQLADVVMVYLLGIILFSARFALAPSLTAALLSVAAFDYFFIPPYLTFNIMDIRHGVTFFVMFLVAIVISGQTQRIRNQAASARERETRTANLYALSHDLSEARTLERVIETAASHLERAFASRVAVFTANARGTLERVYANPALPAATERDRSVSEWVWAHQQEAGLGTSTLPGGSALHMPLTASGGAVGVLSLSPSEPDRFDDLEQRRQVEAFATQLAMAIERAQLAEETQRARLQVETEQLRSSLLSSVSHDLRTPLAVITGAASTLVEGGARVEPAERMDLTETILEEAERLNRLIRNLLDMTRLESGTVKVHKEWMSLEEVVGTALDRMDARLAQREVRVQLPELPLLPFDGLLIEQVLINLLENAVKYSHGAIEISATLTLDEVVIEVGDHGPGVPAGEELLVFDKFHRAVRERSPGGVGLGLAICRAIVAAHGGRIWVENRPEGGARFRFALPIEGEPPALPLPERPEPSEPTA
jgi:two-component system sensor histidine kinase KdpD